MRMIPLACLFLAAVFAADAWAAPKKSSTGAACSSTGTARKDGKDQDGNTVNCKWDTCTFCAGPAGELDCSVMKTEYSNPTDCSAARAGGTRITPGNIAPGVLDPGGRSTRPPASIDPGGGVLIQ